MALRRASDEQERQEERERESLDMPEKKDQRATTIFSFWLDYP